MPAMRARRGARIAPQPAPRRSSVPAGTPKLAAIKLDSSWSAPPKLTRNGVFRVFAGALLTFGAAVAGAAWIGGSLFDAQEAFAQRADSAFAAAGFTVSYDIAGASEARRGEVLEAATLPHRASLLFADPRAIKTRVESLDWVAHARVVRQWPQTVRIEIERRDAFARWQENGQVSVIDEAGERLLAERAADYPDLPLVVGAGAGPAAGEILVALEQLPALQHNVTALVRVGARRWNLETKSGAVIALPEEGAVSALARFEGLEARHRLLARSVTLYDLRLRGLLRVENQPGLLGADSNAAHTHPLGLGA